MSNTLVIAYKKWTTISMVGPTGYHWCAQQLQIVLNGRLNTCSVWCIRDDQRSVTVDCGDLLAVRRARLTLRIHTQLAALLCEVPGTADPQDLYNRYVRAVQRGRPAKYSNDYGLAELGYAEPEHAIIMVGPQDTPEVRRNHVDMDPDPDSDTYPDPDLDLEQVLKYGLFPE